MNDLARLTRSYHEMNRALNECGALVAPFQAPIGALPIAKWPTTRENSMFSKSGARCASEIHLTFALRRKGTLIALSRFGGGRS